MLLWLLVCSFYIFGIFSLFFFFFFFFFDTPAASFLLSHLTFFSFRTALLFSIVFFSVVDIIYCFWVLSFCSLWCYATFCRKSLFGLLFFLCMPLLQLQWRW